MGVPHPDPGRQADGAAEATPRLAMKPALPMSTAEVGLVAGARFSLVPSGRYIVRFEKAELGWGWPDRKTGMRKRILYLIGQILVGDYAGTRLFLPLNVTFRGKRPRPSSAFYQAWTVAMDRQPSPGEPMPYKVFVGKIFSAEVETVTRDARGRERAAITQYSRISRLLQLLPLGWEASRPQTGDRGPKTEYHTPPSSPGNVGIAGGCEEGVVKRRQPGGRGVAEVQEQTKQPGGGP